MIYEGLRVRDQQGHGFLLVMTCLSESWIRGGTEMVMVELPPVKGMYLCNFLIFFLIGDGCCSEGSKFFPLGADPWDTGLQRTAG